MFKKNEAHEVAIFSKYHDNHRHKYTVEQRINNRRRGVPGSKKHHLARKLRKCYPRGRAWYEIIDLHTFEWLHSH
jgi:hypothetical protein